MPLPLLPLLAANASPLTGVWATWTREVPSTHVEIMVEVATDGVDPDTKQLEYKLRRSERSLDGVEVTWANSRRCAAARPVLASMRDLAPPRIAPPGIGDERIELTVDGALYFLSTAAAYGREDAKVTMSSNLDTPLAAWVDRSLVALDRCWSAVE